MGAPPGGETGTADRPGGGDEPDMEERHRRAMEALAAAEMGVWDWDVVTGQLLWDDQIARLHGLDPAAFDGTLATFLSRVHPDDEPHVSAAITEALGRGGPFLVEFRVVRPDGSTAWIQGRGRAILDPDGSPRRMVGVGADTTRLHTTREQVGRALEHIFDGVVIVDRDWRIVYANPAALALVHRRRDELLGRRVGEVFTDIAGTGFERWLERTWVTQRPASLEAWYEPLHTWFEVRAFPAPDGMTFSLRDDTARRQALEAQASLVQRLEEALSRQKQVEQVVIALAEALTVEDVSAIVLTEAARVLDTRYAGIALLDAEQRALTFVSMHPLPPPVAARWSTVSLDHPTPMTDAVRRRQPIYHGSRAAIARDYPDRRLAGVAEASAAHAFANVPLQAGDRLLGALTLSWGEERTFEAEERSFVATLASQCAQAVERAQLFSHQLDVANTLQQAMLPGELPALTGASLAACYLPATEGLTVGGDWYDALVLPDGQVALAVGDVAGHGVEAAAVMGQIRNALRGYLIDGAGPSAALAKLDTFVELAGHGLFATVVVGLYQPSTGALRWANAGHPPPLLTSGGVGRFLTGGVRPPLGVHHRSTHGDQQAVLGRGDVLVGYTDGLVERRRESLDAGLGRLADAVAAAGPPDGTPWCVALVDGLLPRRVRYDDVCVLTLRRT